MTIYAIGDIHGQTGMLDAALERIDRDGGETGPDGADEVIFLGDLVDRGPDAAGVIEKIASGIAQGKRWTAIRGNHDTMFRRFLRDGTLHDAAILSGNPWTHFRLGGVATLYSYGLDPDLDHEDLVAAAQKAVPQHHVEFLDTCPLWIERGGWLFVHAGIRPGVALEKQAEQDLIWIRDGFLTHAGDLPWTVVHGHTVMDDPVWAGNRVSLDTGAGAMPPRHLTVAAIEDDTVFILTDEGRQELLREAHPDARHAARQTRAS
ncbi:metallophosphoesterase [Pseudooceanicola algae]|uniref:Bis(5'-nucleosyl)-tetraphosphatase, symmetrical n=1 Tax=Pseudooceanicola algae TaxID=1537215 RepID=A0A418SFY1_9RHOB|nr:metallophosphoesterase [Pseudooceanicola algae]QPM91574.1 Bis(5'-nucleosyl)-tetraphosphatase, symmetrical [Pseudooceanicola algae]